MAPNYKYLSTWESTASVPWLALKEALVARFHNKHKQLEEKQAELAKKKVDDEFGSLKNKYSDFIRQFYEVAERRVSIIDSYGDESWSALPKEIDALLKKIGTQEGHNEDEFKRWKKYSHSIPSEFKLLSKY